MDTHVPMHDSDSHLFGIARGRALHNALSFIKTSDLPTLKQGLEHTTESGGCRKSDQPFNSVTTPETSRMSNEPHQTIDDVQNAVDTGVHVIDISKIGCICNRSVKTVLCRSCGQMFSGRVRRICLLHPNSIHLMDMVCCPNCKASQMKEFADFDKKRNS